MIKCSSVQITAFNEYVQLSFRLVRLPVSPTKTYIVDRIVIGPQFAYYYKGFSLKQVLAKAKFRKYTLPLLEVDNKEWYDRERVRGLLNI